MILPESPPREAEVGGHYDELDPLYRELWGEDLHHGLWEGAGDDAAAAVRRLTDRVAGAAAVGAGDRVCDVGCGYGRTAEVLAREHGASGWRRKYSGIWNYSGGESGTPLPGRTCARSGSSRHPRPALHRVLYDEELHRTGAPMPSLIM